MTKLEKIREQLSNKGIDALFVFDELNQHYLSDFAFSDGLLLISKHRAELVTDFRYFEMAEKSASREFRISMPKNRGEFISSFLSEENIKTVGVEGNFLSHAKYTELSSKYQGVELVDIGDMIESLRAVKTDEEIKYIQAAQDITDGAFSHLIKMITPNMTEIEVAAELEYYIRRNGGDGFAFDTIAVSGDASALPHGVPRNVKLKAGFLTLDYGAKYNGYCSDMTRTVVIGKADAEMKKLYNTVLSAQLCAIDYLKEGSDCGEADKIARDIIDAEYEGAFGHSLGHSVGLYIHENPSLSKRFSGVKMRCGEIYTVEPGIYLPSKYGCRIEDMVLIKADGVYNFTHSTKDLIEI